MWSILAKRAVVVASNLYFMSIFGVLPINVHEPTILSFFVDNITLTNHHLIIKIREGSQRGIYALVLFVV
jgi:hypothetical protein